VLVPLSDIAPDWIYPTSGAGIKELLENVDCEGIVRITDL
jgi:7,8-dihydro-6-hydroxymethylpterin-pyrophosphokinase